MNKREIRFDSKCKIKASFYSSPIEDEILQEMGIDPGFDPEKLVDEPEFQVNFVTDDAKSHFCTVHKAVVSIARSSVGPR